jgi:membrane protease YdiL (CAAX protease family)
MKKAKQYFFTIIAIIATLIAYGYLQGCYFFPKSYLRFGQFNSLYLAAVTVLILFIIFYLYKKQLQTSNYWHFNQRPHWRWRNLLIAIAALVMIYLAQIVLMTLIGGGDSSNQAALNRIGSSKSSNVLLFNIMVVLLAPICEEVVFRGMFFNLFFTKAKWSNKLLGILCSGFVFAYVHDPHFSKYYVVYWLMGCILAWTYLTTRDLRYSILVHMGNNFISILPSLLV